MGLCVKKAHLQQHGLEAREGGADAQVNLLARIHCP